MPQNTANVAAAALIVKIEVTLNSPAGTPLTIVNRLSGDISKVVHQADVTDRLLKEGFEPVGSNPAQFAAQIKSEVATMGKVIKDTGIRAE